MGQAAVVSIGPITVHDVTPAEVDAHIEAWLGGLSGHGRYVCTPNVDYVFRARSDEAFREAIEGADLRVPDGMWIVRASRIAGRPLRTTVTGRLLLPRWAERCRDAGWSLGMLGAGPGVADAAARRLRARLPGLRITHAITPPMGFEVGSELDREILARLVADPPDLLFVALGAPKQELWMLRHRDELPTTLMIGVGAAFDIEAGRFRRSPDWATRLGLEWLVRLAQEPRRLWRRYLVDDPWILWWAFSTRLRGGDRG
jgi:N-acetylglucosaminyldiphosphoundecaprenol N-acetyl-beta-D-mannosaminyltransferase